MGGKKKGPAMPPVFKAADDGDLDGLVACLKEDPALLHSKNKDGWQPLHQAAYSGQVHIVKALLKAGAKVGARCNDGDTPLHYASAQGNVDCLKPLVDAGADTEVRDEDGESPLDVAGSARVKVLLRKLADEKAAQGSDDDDGEWEEVEGDEAEAAMAELSLKEGEPAKKGKGKKR